MRLVILPKSPDDTVMLAKGYDFRDVWSVAMWGLLEMRLILLWFDLHDPNVEM